jgi:hypothetical protein
MSWAVSSSSVLFVDGGGCCVVDTIPIISRDKRQTNIKQARVNCNLSHNFVLLIPTLAVQQLVFPCVPPAFIYSANALHVRLWWRFYDWLVYVPPSDALLPIIIDI